MPRIPHWVLMLCIVCAITLTVAFGIGASVSKGHSAEERAAKAQEDAAVEKESFEEFVVKHKPYKKLMILRQNTVYFFVLTLDGRCQQLTGDHYVSLDIPEIASTWDLSH